MIEEILNYDEMCRRENTHLVKGINFNLGDRYSIVLMSRTPDAPYHDEFQENNTVLIYEGHDVPQKEGIDPKTIDQPERILSGKLTQNGKFHEAAQQFLANERTAERVKVYENLKKGIWIYHGFFLLTDSWVEHDGTRNVFKFKLNAMNDSQFTVKDLNDIDQRKIIPSNTMLSILEKYGCKCNICNSIDNLSFIAVENNSLIMDDVKIVCDKHNLSTKTE